jgi:hypothetical protein
LARNFGKDPPARVWFLKLELDNGIEIVGPYWSHGDVRRALHYKKQQASIITRVLENEKGK